MMLQAAFYATAIGGSAYFLLRRREFDFFSIGFASGLVYFLPGFVGFVRSSSDYSVAQPLHPETYLVFIAVLSCVLIGAVLFDQMTCPATRDSAKSVPLELTSETALAIALFGLVATILTSGSDLFSAQKSDVMEVTGRWHILFRFGAMYLLAFAIARKQAFFAAAGLVLLLFDLFVGYRIGVVVGVLAAATVVLNRKGVQSLIRNERRTILLGVLLIAAIFIYKRIYTVIKLGLWDVVVDRLLDPEILLLALFTSEPFGTQTILNEVIRTGFHATPSHLSGVVSLLVPFSNNLGAEIQSFNDLFQQKLFGGVVRGGMANNIWAQMYAIGGWAALSIAIPVFVGCLGLGSWLLNSSRGSAVVLVAVLFTFLAFYIHRNDVLYMLVLLRRCLMIWIVMVVPGMLLVDNARSYFSARADAAHS